MIRARTGFVMHKMLDDYMIIAVGENAQSFHSIIQTNDTGAFYWQMIEQGTTPEAMIKAVMERYDDVDEETARQDVTEFIQGIMPAIETIQ